MEYSHLILQDGVVIRDYDVLEEAESCRKYLNDRQASQDDDQNFYDSRKARSVFTLEVVRRLPVGSFVEE